MKGLPPEGLLVVAVERVAAPFAPPGVVTLDQWIAARGPRHDPRVTH